MEGAEQIMRNVARRIKFQEVAILIQFWRESAGVFMSQNKGQQIMRRFALRMQNQDKG